MNKEHLKRIAEGYIPIPLRVVVSSETPDKWKKLAIKSYYVGFEHGVDYNQIRLKEALGLAKLVDEVIALEKSNE